MDERKGKREVATVVDVVPKIPERFDDSRRAQHGGAHRRARNARPRIDRRAEDGDRSRKRRRPPRLESLLGGPLPAQDLPFPMNPGCAILEPESENIASNEGKIAPSERKRFAARATSH
jgi:hypothetical protein